MKARQELEKWHLKRNESGEIYRKTSKFIVKTNKFAVKKSKKSKNKN